MALDEDIVVLVFPAVYWKHYATLISLCSLFVFSVLRRYTRHFLHSCVIAIHHGGERVVNNSPTLGPGGEAPLLLQDVES